ncbi:MAG: RdgB/HAM1 family non-canonical purine NTP pyrophosphatase [Methylococcales bacterium]|nr:RdgB/HAM1 family non-canonical purine NTP pyrophosphatase [Methylococcaceae bacterium]
MLETAQQLVLASSNFGKIREIQALLPDYPIAAQSAFDIQDAEETGQSFVENAIIKARNAALYSGLPAIADDSGLVVDALFGQPGVLSARYAGVGAGDQENVQKLLQALEGVPDAQRTARFVCVMVFMQHAEDPLPVITQGVWEGRILHQPKGDNGFGYDPVFWVPERDCASAELPADVKNALSHRGKALKTLTALIQLSAAVQASM